MIVLSPKIPTSYTGIFYKEVINDDKKVVDKVFLIRYKDEIGRDKQKTIGKYSQGIRLTYCKAIRDETIVKIKLGENLPKATAKKSKYTLHDLAIKWLDLKKANKKAAEKSTANQNFPSTLLCNRQENCKDTMLHSKS